MFSSISQQKPVNMSCDAPLECAQFIHLHTPTLITHGTLYDKRFGDLGDLHHHVHDSSWPYIIMHYIHGSDLLETFPLETSSPELIELSESAAFLGKYLRNLHQFQVPIASKPNVNPLYNNGWHGFDRWIVKQRRIVTKERVIEVGSLSPKLFREVAAYLPCDGRTLREWYCEKYNLERPRLLHNDLNEEHLLLIDKKPYCVIDYGDCRLGDPQYEWIAVFISSLRCNKRLMRIALMEYYQVKSEEELEEAVGGWKRFARTMLSYTLLHEHDAMRSVYNRRPELMEVDNFEQLEVDLWDLSKP